MKTLILSFFISTVKNALELLNDLPLEAEICAQWYEKEDMVMGDEPISDELWSEALGIMDKWECSDLRELLVEALFQARKNKEREETK